jgi:hypothetical protein
MVPIQSVIRASGTVGSKQIVFDCPAVRREVSRNDRENDHGEESKEGE